MEPIIEVCNLSKRYLLGAASPSHTSLREVLAQAWRNPFGARKGGGAANQAVEFFALRDLNFNIAQGETVAIIGSNGAGKSTLLKIMSRITQPTSGQVKIRGRMASLLEVGTGFHPELTGRENIYLNSAILGMRKEETDAKFDDIVLFAGVDKFLDTPVKRYSSGMYVRLAFSIAAHLEPEILIVDEVLAVGDVAFQKKCLGKMAEACAQARTVLFVSHNLAAVESLCRRAIVLRQGRLVFDGPSKEAIQYYLHNVVADPSEAAADSHVVDLSSAPGRPSKYLPQLQQLELYTAGGRPVVGSLPAGASLQAVIRFRLDSPATSFDPFLVIDSTSGQRICMAHSAYEPARIHEQRSGEQVFVCDIPTLPLVPGDYRLHVGLDLSNQQVDWVEDAMQLNLVKSDFYGTGIVPEKGIFMMQNRWALQPEPAQAVAAATANRY